MAKDLIGEQFGRLIVIDRADDYVSPKGIRKIRWLCKCSCGNENIVVVTGDNLRSGEVKSCKCLRENSGRKPSKSNIEQRLGEKAVNKCGEIMTIVKYNKAIDIWVEFEGGHRVHTQYSNFKSGYVKNPYNKSVYGIGYIGEGDYKVSSNEILTPHYDVWSSMIQRCYNKNTQEKHASYIGCTVCDEWHNYQNFAKWYDENFYSIPNCKMQIDKDILFKGNKIYSPTTCVFVPSQINAVFTKREISRGELPIGVQKSNNRYVSSFTRNKQITYLGYYNTPLEAFQAYKFAKEQYIKQLANKYIKYLPNNLYNALMNYQVEIDD